MCYGQAGRVILWGLFVVLALTGFAILSVTVLLLMWQMVEVGLLWVVLLIGGFVGVYVVVVLWERYVKGPGSEDKADEPGAAADLW
jgi:mannose/fructose/N-acetylgalactosamine-specific phosphotransferase system component IID